MAETTCSTCAAVLDIPVGSSAMDAQIAHVLAEHPEGLCVDGPITCPRPEECGICPAADRYRARRCDPGGVHPVSITEGSCPCGRFRIAGSDAGDRLVDREPLVRGGRALITPEPCRPTINLIEPERRSLLDAWREWRSR